MPDKDELDVLLDSALATYADPGADSGLEQRVLMALAGERKAGGEHRWSWRRWRVWAIAVPVAASLLLWMGVENVRHRPGVGDVRARQSGMAAPPHAAATDTASVRRPATHPTAAKATTHLAAVAARLKSCPVTKPNASVSRESVSIACSGAAETSLGMLAAEVQARPKLDVFPTPQPLTPEEQVLAAAATDSSPVVQAAIQTPQITGDAPLSIAALDIPPLAVSGKGQK